MRGHKDIMNDQRLFQAVPGFCIQEQDQEVHGHIIHDLPENENYLKGEP
jgi:hypothetical protein